MKKNLGIISILIIIATLFVTVFSHTTSPIYPCINPNYTDSPAFQIIGKYWSEGVIPYKDLWDMKGPYIFLMNAIGYGLTGTRTGVYLLQIAFMTITLSGIFRMYRLYYSLRCSFVMTSISLMPLFYVYDGGNLVAEYLLPFLSFSFYYILRWVNDIEQSQKIEHNPNYAILYGIVFGISLMSRLTNALSICGAVVVISFVLLYKKEYKNFVYNICTFIIGFSCFTLPFFFYFNYHHALPDMWKATFTYPMEYALHSSKNMVGIVGIFQFILYYWNSILLLVVSALLVVHNRRVTIRTSLWFMAAFLPFLWFCQGNGIANYGMIVFPLFTIAMIELSNLRLNKVFLSVIIMIFITSVRKFFYNYILYDWQNTESSNCIRFLNTVPNINYSSFVVYNCAPSIYLELDICPAVPFFAVQGIAFEKRLTLCNDIINSFQEKQPEWILISNNIIGLSNLQPILDKDYNLVAAQEDKHLLLYEKKIKATTYYTLLT